MTTPSGVCRGSAARSRPRRAARSRPRRAARAVRTHPHRPLPLAPRRPLLPAPRPPAPSAPSALTRTVHSRSRRAARSRPRRPHSPAPPAPARAHRAPPAPAPGRPLPIPTNGSLVRVAPRRARFARLPGRRALGAHISRFRNRHIGQIRAPERTAAVKSASSRADSDCFACDGRFAGASGAHRGRAGPAQPFRVADSASARLPRRRKSLSG